MWVNCALLDEMEQFTMSDVLRGKYCKAKVEKTDKNWMDTIRQDLKKIVMFWEKQRVLF